MKTILIAVMASLATAAFAFFPVEKHHVRPAPARGVCVVTITYDAADPRAASVSSQNPVSRSCTNAGDRVAIGSVVFGLLAGE